MRGAQDLRPLFLLLIFWRFIMRSSRLESGFQDRLIDILKTRLPGCLTFKLDRQGFPDLLVLYRDKWAALECKRTITAHKQPNQEHYVRIMNEMSFARFIAPENRDEVLAELDEFFGY